MLNSCSMRSMNSIFCDSLSFSIRDLIPYLWNPVSHRRGLILILNLNQSSLPLTTTTTPKVAPLCSKQTPLRLARSRTYKMLLVAPLSALPPLLSLILSFFSLASWPWRDYFLDYRLWILILNSGHFQGTSACARSASWATILDWCHSLRRNSSHTGTFSQSEVAPSEFQAKDLGRHRSYWTWLAKVSIDPRCF